MKIQVPVIEKVDTLFLGATTHACTQMLELAENGHSVFMVTPFAYPGEDICSTLDLQSRHDSEYRELFHTDALLNPAKIKYTLEQRLIDAKIGYLFQTHPAALAYDKQCALAGMVVANRSGFQLIAAKTIVDATGRSLGVRMTGAETEPFVPGIYSFELNTIGGAARMEGLEVTELPQHVVDQGIDYPVFRVVKKLELKDNSPWSLAQTDVAMRLAAADPETRMIADCCRYDLRDGISKNYQPAPELPVFLSARTTPEEIAEAIQRSTAGKPVGCRETALEHHGSDIVRKDRYFRAAGCETIEFELNSIPEIGDVDVLIGGGGTGGASAAISAARTGVRTLCVENLSVLGGITTAGRISCYWYGNRVGFTKEMDLGASKIGNDPNYDIGKGRHTKEWKSIWLLREAAGAGCKIFFNSLIPAVSVNGSRMTGAVVATPFGLALIRAKALVDATGNSDLAAAAGAETAPLTGTDVAVQGAGLSPYELNNNYSNTDYQFICDSDVTDGTRALTMSAGKFKDSFDLSQILNTRERRRIIGDIILQPQDFFAHRCYHDTINIAMSNFDTHGFIIHPMFMLKPTEHSPYYAHVPFRALLPKGMEGVLVTGLGVSAHRDCMPLIRMQPDVQNQGYAAGYACAMSAKQNRALREISIRDLQKHLVEKEILPESILADEDHIAGVEKDDSHYELASIFLDEAKALPELRQKFRQSPDLHTAHILAFLGDASGKDLLIRELNSNEWDEGWNYTGMGQFGKSVSVQDSMIFALNRIGGDKNVILNKLKSLTMGHHFSHIRAISVALMTHPDADAVPMLEALLNTPGATGHAVCDLQDALDSNREDRNDTSVRNAQLRELYAAKALKACDPDSELANSILKEYASSMMGYYAQYAQSSL